MSRLQAPAMRVFALTSVLAVSGTLPSAVLASERAPTAPAPSIRATASNIAVVESHRLDRNAPPLKAREQQSGQTADPKLESGSFFRRPIGIAVLATLGIGAGYALYSASNDRIRSSGR